MDPLTVALTDMWFGCSGKPWSVLLFFVCPQFQCMQCLQVLNSQVDVCSACVFEQMQMQMQMKIKKNACVVTFMLFMALALSWKGFEVSRVSVQTLFIIIIIIIINHLSSGIPGSGNALNHWPGRTWILHLKGKGWRERKDWRKEW